MTTLFDAIERADAGMVWQLSQNGAELDAIDESTGMTALAQAAEAGQVEIVRTLLDAGAAPDSGGVTTPLEAAVVEGHVDVAQTLITAGADVNRAVEDGFTPLMTAAATGDLLLVELLLKAGARPRKTNDEGQTAISLAKEAGHDTIVALLRSSRRRKRPAAADKVEAKPASEDASSSDVATADVATADVATADVATADVAATEATSTGPVMSEAPSNDGPAEVTDEAVSAEAPQEEVVAGDTAEEATSEVDLAATPTETDVKEVVSPKATAKTKAAAKSKTTAKATSNSKAKAAAKSKKALEEDVAAEKPDTVEKPGDVTTETGEPPKTSGTSPAPEAELAASGKEASEKARPSAGRDGEDASQRRRRGAGRDHDPGNPNHRPHQAPEQALPASVEDLQDQVEALADLIEKGKVDAVAKKIKGFEAGTEARDPEGRTLLMIAAKRGDVELVSWLLDQGADFEAIDRPRTGHTVLVHATQCMSLEREKIIRRLVEQGADINRPCGQRRRTPLMHAADADVYLDRVEGPVFAVSTKTLIKLGARMESKDSRGNTAWQLIKKDAIGAPTYGASRRRLHQMLRVLEHGGAQVIASHAV